MHASRAAASIVRLVPGHSITSDTASWDPHLRGLKRFQSPERRRCPPRALDVLARLRARNVILHMIDLGGDVTGNVISK